MVIIYVIIAGLALIGFISKRRFGLACLGLVAGSIISANWASYVTAILQVQGIRLLSPPLDVVVGISLILLPALLLLMVGPKHRGRIMRTIGSLIIACLALGLIISELARDLPGLVASNPLLIMINRLQPIIVVVAIVLALGDIIHGHIRGKKRKAIH